MLRVAWLVVADFSEIYSLHLKFLHWVLTSGNVMGGNTSEKYFASMFRVCFFFCVYSSSVALQPKLGLGLFNPPSPGISVLCRPYPVPELQHPPIISVHCILPPSSGPSNWCTLSYVSFRCFLGTLSSFIPITWSTHWNLLNLIFLVDSVYLYKLQISWFYLFPHHLFTNAVPKLFLELFSQVPEAFIIIIIIIINIKDWTLWSVPSPELQLLGPTLLRSSNCSFIYLFIYFAICDNVRDSPLP